MSPAAITGAVFSLVSLALLVIAVCEVARWRAADRRLAEKLAASEAEYEATMARLGQERARIVAEIEALTRPSVSVPPREPRLH